MPLQKHFIVITLSIFTVLSLKGQTDREIVNREEHLIMPHISTNGYGINFVYAKKRKLDRYFAFNFGIAELKHRKEIKGINPRYPNQNEFIYGKIHHAYPLRFGVGYHEKIVLKNSNKSIGIRYHYNAGIELALLKPVYYQIELVYSQDSSKTITTQFNSEYHNVNNIRNRTNWFKGIDQVKIHPGISIEAGMMVDFSRRQRHIQGVGISAIMRGFILPVEILEGEPQRRFYFGFSISYVWGKYSDYVTGNQSDNVNKGWNMLKNPKEN